MMNRDLLAIEALKKIPKLLSLLDRNPHSPTYGCFDRYFWQYRVIDFPSGIVQSFIFPVALAAQVNVPGNPFYNQPIIREWVEGSLLFTVHSAHRDGSCDDYFPFEKAGGAAAFSLLGCIESYYISQLNNQLIVDFLVRRANWLANHHESGRLTNHRALIALCLMLLSDKLNTDRWNKAIQGHIEQVLAWQNPEGWFQEYDGYDPGYHTLTISCLARIYQFLPDNNIKDALAKAVSLAAYFVHPDGSYGGEYGSRNTYSFFPHGFELVGQWMPEALTINDRFLEGLEKGLIAGYDDDHLIGHHAWNYLLAWQDFVIARPSIQPKKRERLWLKEGGILVHHHQDTALYVALNKGGVFKFFRGNQLIASDTHFSLQVKSGQAIENVVGHLVSQKYKIQVHEDRILIEGNLGFAKHKQMTTAKSLVLRLVMLTVGRFFPDLIRKILQKILITGKKNAPFYFRREFSWDNGQLIVNDQITAQSWETVINMGIGCDQTSIYVAMSRPFQPGQLQLWRDLTDRIEGLKGEKTITLERKL